MTAISTLQFRALGNNTTASDPGPGGMKFSTRTQYDATSLYFNKFDDTGTDSTSIFASLLTGDTLEVQLDKNASVITSYILAAPVTDNTGWFTASVTPGSASNGFPVNNNSLVDITTTGVAPPLMTSGTFDYYIKDFSITDTSEDWMTQLNVLGAQGWQLTWVTNLVTDDEIIRAWFVRKTG
jgi:hypothetical protein